MTRAADLVGDVRVTGNLTYGGTLKPDVARSNVAQEVGTYPLNLTDFRVWDAMQTNLPGTAATDDLALIGGTFATGVPSIQTGDLKTAGATTRYARILIQLPPEYEAGETVVFRLHSGMVTTVADGSATIDLEVYLSGRETVVSGGDLCATSATSINSLTFADKDFTITATSLSPGDWLDCRLAITVTDTATGTAVIGCLGSFELRLDIRG